MNAEYCTSHKHICAKSIFGHAMHIKSLAYGAHLQMKTDRKMVQSRSNVTLTSGKLLAFLAMCKHLGQSC